MILEALECEPGDVPLAFTFNNKMYQVPKSQLNKIIKILNKVPETADDMDTESVPVK